MRLVSSLQNPGEHFTMCTHTLTQSQFSISSKLFPRLCPWVDEILTGVYIKGPVAAADEVLIKHSPLLLLELLEDSKPIPERGLPCGQPNVRGDIVS